MIFQRFPLTARFGTSSSLFRHQRKQRCTALKSTAAAEAAAVDSKPLKPEFLFINSSPVFTDPRQGLLLTIYITLRHKRKLCRCFYLTVGNFRMIKAFGKNKNLNWFFILFPKCASDEMSSLLIPLRFRRKHIGEINFSEISPKFLCGPRFFLLVH
jgi:hypothetical protein